MALIPIGSFGKSEVEVHYWIPAGGMGKIAVHTKDKCHGTLTRT